MESKFKAKLSNLSIVITIIFNLLIISTCYAMLFHEDLLKNINQPPNIVVKLLTVIFLIVVTLITFLLRPKSYAINNSHIKINKPLYSKKIDIKSILDIKEINYENLAIRAKLFGSGGVWGYFGLYLSSKFGRINMETTNFNNLIFIINKNKKITILSPDNSNKFLEKTKSIIEKFALCQIKS